MTTRNISLYVDDVRAPADLMWVLARSPGSAIDVLKTGAVERLSLDYDLGAAGTADKILDWMESAARTGWRPPRTMMAHSQNPVGRNLINLRINDVLQYASDFDTRIREVDYPGPMGEPPVDQSFEEIVD